MADRKGITLTVNGVDRNFYATEANIEGELGSDVDAGEINSGTASSGQVLTADGLGGASWVESGGGKLYQHNINAKVYYNGRYASFGLILYTKDLTPFNNNVLSQYLQDNNFVSAGSRLPVNMFSYYPSTGNYTQIPNGGRLYYHDSDIYIEFDLFELKDGAISGRHDISWTFKPGGTGVNDTVIEL